MKIKVAVIDEDKIYVKKLVSYFQLNYSGRIEIYAFSEFESFEEFLGSNIIHVVLLSEKMAIDSTRIPSEMSFAWLVCDNSIKEWKGSPAICKYQKLEMLYKQMLGLYADLKGKMVLKSGGDSRFILFTSAQGGVGASTAAAAYSLFLGRQGRKVLYLNLDFLGSSDFFFRGEGSTGFSDVIYALKSRNEKIAIKLESIIRHDIRGVSFFAPSRNTNDMLELEKEEADELLTALNGMECCQYIVVDMPMDFSPICTLVMEKYAGDIILACDGSQIGNEKIKRAYEVMDYLQKKDKSVIWAKCRLLYQRCQPGAHYQGPEPGMDIVGEIPYMTEKDCGKLAEELKSHPAICSIGM